MSEIMSTEIYHKVVLGKKFRIFGTFENPLFLAKHVAEWIDYSKTSNGSYNVAKLLMSVDEDEKVKKLCSVCGITNPYTTDNTASSSSSTARDTQEMWFLTENGLYEVLMQSRKPIAKQFKKEVKKLLHQIRIEELKIVPAKVTPEEKMTPEYKAVRKQSKEIRNSFTDNLKSRGYTKPTEYINTTRSMKKALSITNRKEDMTTAELRLVKASEYLAECMLTNEYGYHQVNPVCSYASESVTNVIQSKPVFRLA